MAEKVSVFILSATSRQGIVDGLRIAATKLEENAQVLRDTAEHGSPYVTPDAADRLARQFTKQAEETRNLAQLIEAGEIAILDPDEDEVKRSGITSGRTCRAELGSRTKRTYGV